MFQNVKHFEYLILNRFQHWDLLDSQNRGIQWMKDFQSKSESFFFSFSSSSFSFSSFYWHLSNEMLNVKLSLSDYFILIHKVSKYDISSFGEKFNSRLGMNTFRIMVGIWRETLISVTQFCLEEKVAYMKKMHLIGLYNFVYIYAYAIMSKIPSDVLKMNRKF